MFKNNIRIILLSFFAVSIVAYFIHFSDDDMGVNQTPSSSVNPALIPFKDKLRTVLQSQQLDETKKKTQVHEIIKTLPQPYRRQYQIAMSDLPDLSMYGRVTDQYGQPVVNAGIWQNGGSAYLRGGGGRGYARTDEDGYFRIDTTGAFLELGGITHPEMDYLNYGLRRRSQSGLYGSSIYFSSTPNFSQGELDIRKYDTKEKAFLVHAWRLQGFEGTIKKSSGNVGFKPDGSVYTINFSENEKRRDRSKFITEGEIEGDLWMSCTRDNPKKKGEYGDWRFEITSLNGGIQETSDLYMNIAPEIGYQPTLVIGMKKGDEAYKPAFINKRYYFKAHNGEMYGMLYVTFIPFGRGHGLSDTCTLQFDYRYNPTGSRNLELKRSNTSQPQLPTTQKLASNL